MAQTRPTVLDIVLPTTALSALALVLVTGAHIDRFEPQADGWQEGASVLPGQTPPNSTPTWPAPGSGAPGENPADTAPDAPGPDTDVFDLGTGAPGVFTADPGDCLVDPGDSQTVPCDHPHRGEVFFTYLADGDVYPGRDGFDVARCEQMAGTYVGATLESSGYGLTWLIPTSDSWEHAGDREIICILTSADLVTGSAYESQRTVV